MAKTVIKVEDLSKMYDLGLVGTGTLSRDLNRTWARMLGKPDPYATLAELNDRTQISSSGSVWALKDINFEVQEGEVLGIIGKNGAGKSTLLKILSQITSPTKGSIKIKGRVASLLEVGTGMHPEMTARQNIYLNGAIMGMTRREITAKFDEIVDFAGIVKYVDTPIKRFSSGMQVRLGFAVAAFLEPEILIVDEVLAVGDAEFQKKAIGKMQDVSQSEGRTVLFVSHNLSSIKSLCTKGVLLSNGMLEYDGDVVSVINNYQKNNQEVKNYQVSSSNKELYLSHASLIRPSSDYYDEDEIGFSFKVKSNIPFANNKFLLIRVLNDLEQVLFSSEVQLISGKEEYVMTIPPKCLAKGNYKLNSILYHPAIAVYDTVSDLCNFSLLNNVIEYSHLDGFDIGSLYLATKWE
jgi:lipopolysaccharide transport system ATP-binding protein